MIKIIVRGLAGLPAVIFLVMGLRWLVNPAGIAPEFGVLLASGLGLSAQVGLFSAFFLALGLSILIGLVTERRVWFYAPAGLLLLTAMARSLAYLVHNAAFAGSNIGTELLVAGILLLAARYLGER